MKNVLSYNFALTNLIPLKRRENLLINYKIIRTEQLNFITVEVIFLISSTILLS